MLEFSGGILLLIEKAKTTLESMAADAATDVNQTRSGFPFTPFLPSGASRTDPAEHIDHRPYLESSPKGSSNLSLRLTNSFLLSRKAQSGVRRG